MCCFTCLTGPVRGAWLATPDRIDGVCQLAYATATSRIPLTPNRSVSIPKPGTHCEGRTS